MRQDPRWSGPDGMYGGKQVGTGNCAARDNKIQVFKVYVDHIYLGHPPSNKENEEKEKEKEKESLKQRYKSLARPKKLSISCYDRA